MTIGTMVKRVRKVLATGKAKNLLLSNPEHHSIIDIHEAILAATGIRMRVVVEGDWILNELIGVTVKGAAG